MLSKVLRDIDRFLSLGEREQKAYFRLGIPSDIMYVYKEIKNGKKVHEEVTIMSISGIRANYNKDGIISSQLYWGLHAYLNLKTCYSDNQSDWCEETLRYAVDGSFLDRLEAKGYDVELDRSRKTLGYGFMSGGKAYFEIFEGYPNTSRYRIDWWWVATRRGMYAALPREGEIKILLTETETGAQSELVFKDMKEFDDFLLKDGVKTYMSADGNVAFRFMSTIHGQSRATIFDADGGAAQLNGKHLTNIVIPEMTILI